MEFPQCFGFIPARYDSTRFPGKPLADILGKPMFWHVYTRAKACPRFAAVYLCTDDERIAAAAAAHDVPCIMTRKDHENGSSRVFEAASALNIPGGVPDNAVVVNIQGDEPDLESAMLETLLSPFADPAVLCATLACPIDAEEAVQPDRVKVVRAVNGDALYFSRAAIPHDRDGNAEKEPFLLHVGIYAYRMRLLARYVQLSPTPLERLEKLEQLRLLENGVPMRVMLTEHRSHGVDRPEDIEKILPLLRERRLV
ncbi:MAG: 3-deoxy-manno-octulosonate cytidylyltransferase [Desulfovibrio sp.]